MFRFCVTAVVAYGLCFSADSVLLAGDPPSDFRLEWKGQAAGNTNRHSSLDDILTIRGRNLPGDELRVQYLEAYCREGSRNLEWADTTIGHKTELVVSDND